MEKQDMQLPGITFTGDIHIEGDMFNIHDNQNVTINMNGNQKQQPMKPAEPLSVSVLVACVDNVREYFWTPGAIGFVFCVCRDCYDYPNNMSQFERDFGCPEGSLSNTFRNDTYMHLHIDKWAQNGAKDRVLRLVEAYKKAVAERQKGKE